LILVVASTNAHKIAEISVIAGAFGYETLSRADAGVPDFEVEEDGATFEENSLLKARAIYDWFGGTRAVVADDSGLSVDFLDGAPGVYSARFAGVDGPDADRANNEKLLGLLSDVPAESRAARFVSVITMLTPERAAPIVCRGEVRGRVAFASDGENGFGYDPLFVPDASEVALLPSPAVREALAGLTFGRFPPEEKNRISHRFRALEKLREELRR
jgi:XTP/dITP diphosphohydrolase